MSVGAILSNLSSLIGGEFGTAWGVSGDLEKLSKTFSTIRDVLEDAEQKQFRNKTIGNWLRRLKDAADDILEECAFESLRPESEIGDRSCIEFVSDSFSICFDFKHIIFRYKMGREIKKLRKRFDDIARDKSQFHLSTGDEDRPNHRETSFIQPITYGRVGEKVGIIEMLVGNLSNLNSLSVCPIVGIGGLGKTTLAQLVYNDDAVVDHFGTRIWISVSEDFSVKRITKMILDHLTEKKCDLEDLSPMQNLLKKLMNGRRYLLVLDDVWDNRQGNWEDIMCLLACGAKGSSIIVTTRLPTVVDAISSLGISCVINPTCELERLSKLDSWSLFEHYALGVRDKENDDLVAIGKVVVAKCDGIPLAIKAVGSLLNSKSEEFWRLVRDSEIWHLERHGEDTIFPALRLSYHHLPCDYRQRFAYCAVYPKNSIMKKQSLIHQWMANGFIQSSGGMKVEDVGDDIFNGLLQRFFFQDKHEDEYRVVSCKMHDLFHGLACLITKDECWRINTSMMGGVPQRARHVSVTCDTDSNPSSFNTQNELINSQPFFRTLILPVYLAISISEFSGVKYLRVLDLGNQWDMRIVPSWIGNLKLLKYLNLQNTGIELLPNFVCGLTNLQVLLLGKNRRLTTLPPSVGKLKNLRYLDLSETSIEALPEPISTLTNLQTLKLWCCRKLKMLPTEMKDMKSLRHLIIEWDIYTMLSIKSMPIGIGELPLETLGAFVVSNAGEGAAGIQELGELKELKGSLIIENIRHVRDPRDARQANLKNKKKLLQLKLYWNSGEVGGVDPGNEEEKETSNQVLESLEPDPNIQELLIWQYPGVELPGWIRNCALTLPHLRKLELCFMRNVVHDLHQLPPNLETLWIVDCPKLRLHPKLRFPSSIERLSLSASNDPTLMSVEALPPPPHLSTLHISGFGEKETLSRLRNLTCLGDLWIGNCNVKRILPQLENLRNTLVTLAISNCYDFDSITELQNLASLQTLIIHYCQALKSLSDSSSLRPFTSLTRLNLQNCFELELSAVDFQHLVVLEHLHMVELPLLTSLPDAIQHATNLQSLFIERCENLRILPEWLQQQLPPPLHYLEIKECHPELHRRCEVEMGEDWHKISHLQVHNIK